jgi:protoporphyrin/coproporphyrin ferrochelatase
MGSTAYLLVNFGGPRDLDEIRPFLTELLNDQEVIRTSWPPFLHRLLFTQVARRRSRKILPDCGAIGGKSPIFEDTEALARSVGTLLGEEVITFHRYLPSTHEAFLEKMEALEGVEQIRVVPLFPQFSYATTGSIALWLSKHLSSKTLNKLQWTASYPGNPSYIAAMQDCLQTHLERLQLREEEIALLFSAHGLPERFVRTGDPYQRECVLSFERLSQRFPKALSLLSYQSQFGKEEWIRPYTKEVCEGVCDWTERRKTVVIVPLSFTSDHIETLYEIEELYVAAIQKAGVAAFRCPALGRREDWIQTLVELFQLPERQSNQTLLRGAAPT